MPQWASFLTLYIFTLGLAFYSGRLTVKVDVLKEAFDEFKNEMREEFKALRADVETVRRGIGTRR